MLQWLTQLKNYYAIYGVHDDPTQLTLLAQFLDGLAFDWWNNLLTSKTAPQTFALFEIAFCERWIRQSDSHNARRAITTMKKSETDSVDAHFTKFQTEVKMAAVHQGLMDSTTQAQYFYQSLDPALRQRVTNAARKNMMTDIDVLVDGCVQCCRNYFDPL